MWAGLPRAQGYNKRRLVSQIHKYDRQWDKSKGKWRHVKRKIIATINARTLAIKTNTSHV